MNFKEFEDGRFEKSTDSVERYLLEIVKQYLTSEAEHVENSREYITNKSVERIREELRITQGVTSVNDQTGPVVITPESIGAEPAIPNKKTAFNVDFGNTNQTACEGNDPRLSDARQPVSHTHLVKEIAGLEGNLKTITEAIYQLRQTDHYHDNLSALNKIVYTGNKSEVNLDEIENQRQILDNLFQNMINTMDSKVTQMENEYQKINSIVSTSGISQLRDQIYQKLDNETEEVKEFLSNAIVEAKGYFDTSIQSLSTKEDWQDIISIAESVESLITSQSISIGDIVNAGNEYKVAISEKTQNDLSQFGILDPTKCRIDVSMDNAGSKSYNQLLIYSTDGIAGFITMSLRAGEIWFSYKPIDYSYQVTNEQKNIVITMEFYTQRKVS